MLTYLQAVILGIVQGVTELFPVSGLGHTVFIANLFGWHDIAKQQMADSSAYLGLFTMAQLAIALALFVFYRKDWMRIARGFVHSIQAKNPALNNDARFGWLLLAASVPACLVTLILENGLRSFFATTFFVIIFMTLNGLLLIRGDQPAPLTEISRPRQRKGHLKAHEVTAQKITRVVSDHLTYSRAIKIGFTQIGALFTGFSRSGLTMLMGLRSGLSHQDAARFSFLLAALIFLFLGLCRLPSATHYLHGSTTGPILVGSLLAGIAAFFSVRYLDSYFKTRSLRPFGWYCIAAAGFMLLVSIIRGAA